MSLSIKIWSETWMWNVKRFNELSLIELEAILRLRQSVFIIEQQSLFYDIDGKDRNAIHIFLKKEESIVSYCRITMNEQITIGRVVVNPIYRSHGEGRKLLEYTVEYIQQNFSKAPIHITAMCYLEEFYRSFGFEHISERYEIAGHLHIDMKLTTLLGTWMKNYLKKQSKDWKSTKRIHTQTTLLWIYSILQLTPFKEVISLTKKYPKKINAEKTHIC